jgi:DNA-binding beta-propeller fold protein YncE
MSHVDAKTELVYISDYASIPAGDVNVFTRDGLQVGQITNGMAAPEGLFVDGNRNLWVANIVNVLVFPRGSLSPSQTLTDPVGPPVDVTVCPDGTVYVADLYDLKDTNHASIQVYAPGHTSPTRNLSYDLDFRSPALTCDAAGNVFVSVLVKQSLPDAGVVIEVPGGKQAGVKDLGIVFQDVYGIKPDNAGNLLVSDFVARTITEYTESGMATGVQIATGKAQIFGIALSRDGKFLLGADVDFNRGIVWSFPEGKVKKRYTCCSRISLPMQSVHGVAFDPGQAGI